MGSADWWGPAEAGLGQADAQTSLSGLAGRVSCLFILALASCASMQGNKNTQAVASQAR